MWASKKNNIYMWHDYSLQVYDNISRVDMAGQNFQISIQFYISI